MTSFWTEKKNYDPTLVFIAIPKPSTATGVCKRLVLNVRQFAINMSFRDRCSDRHDSDSLVFCKHHRHSADMERHLLL